MNWKEKDSQIAVPAEPTLSVRRPIRRAGQDAYGWRRSALSLRRLGTLLGLLALTSCRRQDSGSAGADILAPDERAWLDARQGQLVIAPDPRWRDADDNPDAYAGMEMDFVRLLEAKLGARFNTYRAPTAEEFERAVSEMRVDILPAARITPDRARDWLFTRPYMNVPVVLLVNTKRKASLTVEELHRLRLAVGRKYAVRDFVTSTYDHLTIFPSKTDLDALLDLSLGQLDVVVMDLETASRVIEAQGLANIRVAGHVGPTYEFSMACRSDNPMLHRLLDKGLEHISEREKRRIYEKWLRFGAIPFYLSRVFWSWLAGGLAVILAILAAILMWNRTLRRQVEQATHELLRELGERKRAEAALSLAHSELEKRVEERTHELAKANRSLEREIGERRQAEREVLEISSEERKRIGRDLHDSLGQELAGISCLAEVTSRRLTTADSPESGNAAKIVTLIGEAISHAKIIVRGLMPVEIAEEGLTYALRRLAEESSHLLRMDCCFETGGHALVFNNDVATNLYRIAQESISNAARHGGATRVVVRLTVGVETGTLTIEDNGQGMAAPRQTGGMGMRIMRYRAEMCGGALRIEPALPTGTVINCTFVNRTGSAPGVAAEAGDP